MQQRNVFHLLRLEGCIVYASKVPEYDFLEETETEEGLAFLHTLQNEQ
jgi:NifB/MoaA-like Fe-S oxidoreductase